MPLKPAPKPGTRRLDLVDLEDVVRAIENPKRHDLDGIRDLIARFGFIDLIALDERTGRLISGHGRLEALEAMHSDGEDPPDGIIERGKRWLVPVVRGWQSENDAEAMTALLGVNEAGRNGGWYEKQLAGILNDLGDLDRDLVRLAGWSDEKHAALVSRVLDSDDGGYDGPGGPRGQAPPDEFPSYGDGVETTHRCPCGCGYEWNGACRPSE